MEATIQRTSTPSIVRIWTVFGSIIIALLCGSWVLRHSLERWSKPPLQVFSHIQGDLSATERSGQTVQLSSLRGKVFVCAYIYTICPHGCAAVVGEMQKLLREFGSHPDFHLVSIAVAPERDTPEFFRAYAEGVGVKPADPWWFLTGEKDALWGFMTNELKLEPAKAIPEKERLNPLDFYEHDLRIVLVDRRGNVRGYYAVFHPEPEIASLMCEKLQNDVRRLLEQPQL